MLEFANIECIQIINRSAVSIAIEVVFAKSSQQGLCQTGVVCKHVLPKHQTNGRKAVGRRPASCRSITCTFTDIVQARTTGN